MLDSVPSPLSLNIKLKRSEVSYFEESLEYPLILIHGWTDKPLESGTFKVLERILTKNGTHFFVPEVARFGTIEERSQRLIEDMAKTYPRGQRVHLVGHSMVS